MSTMDERERGFEAKFAHDAQMQFKAEARRNKLLGLWAAEKMGLSDAEAYASEVIKSDFEEAGDEDVFRKVSGDLTEKGVSFTEQDLRETMVRLMAQAKAQLMDEAG